MVSIWFVTALLGWVLVSSVIDRGKLNAEKSPKGSMEYVIENAKCRDILISGGLSINETTYYMRRLHAPDCIKYQVFPASMNDHPGWMNPPGLLERSGELTAEANTMTNSLKKELGPHNQVWFFYESVTNRQKVLEMLKNQLDQKMVLKQTLEGHGSFFTKVFVYVSRE